SHWRVKPRNAAARHPEAAARERSAEAGRELDAAVDAQLAEGVLQVRAHGRERDVELTGDLFVGQAVGGEPGDLGFTRAQFGVVPGEHRRRVLGPILAYATAQRGAEGGLDHRQQRELLAIEVVAAPAAPDA